MSPPRHGARSARASTHLVPGLRRGGDRPMPEPYPAGPSMPDDPGLAADGPPGVAAPAGSELTSAHLTGGSGGARGGDRLGQAGRHAAGPPTGRDGDGNGQPVPADKAASPSLVRSSGVMALGTLASRVTGLLRT